MVADVPVRRKIVVVDDNEDALLAICALLEALGYEMRCIDDPTAAMSLIKTFRPHAAIFDLRMPALNGLELAKLARDDPETARLPLIALTGFGAQPFRDAAARAGFDAYLVKTAPPDEITRTIEGVIRTALARPH